MKNEDGSNLFDFLINLKNFFYKLNTSLTSFKKFLNYNPKDVFNSNPLSEGKKPFKLLMAEYGSFYLKNEQIPKISTGSGIGDVLALLCKHKSYFTTDKNILKAYGNPDEEVSKIMHDLKRALNRQKISIKYQRTNNGYEITQCHWIK
jgi:hypothetical protein